MRRGSHAAAARGIGARLSLEDLAKKAELFVVIVSTDEQSGEVTDVLSRHAADNALIVDRRHQRPDDR